MTLEEQITHILSEYVRITEAEIIGKRGGKPLAYPTLAKYCQEHYSGETQHFEVPAHCLMEPVIRVKSVYYIHKDARMISHDTPQDVVTKIHALANEGLGASAIGRVFGLSRHTVWDIMNRGNDE